MMERGLSPESRDVISSYVETLGQLILAYEEAVDAYNLSEEDVNNAGKLKMTMDNSDEAVQNFLQTLGENRRQVLKAFEKSTYASLSRVLNMLLSAEDREYFKSITTNSPDTTQALSADSSETIAHRQPTEERD